MRLVAPFMRERRCRDGGGGGPQFRAGRVRIGLQREGIAVPPDELRLRRAGSGWELETDEPTAVLHRLTGWAVSAGVELRHLEVSRRSLEDVYLQLTAETEAAE